MTFRGRARMEASPERLPDWPQARRPDASILVYVTIAILSDSSAHKGFKLPRVAAGHACFLLLLLPRLTITMIRATPAIEIRTIARVDSPDGCSTVTVALMVSEV